MLHTQYARHCSHCHKSLSDPASLEAGIGPQCRNKNNSLYAKTITTKLPVATAIILGMQETELPEEIIDRWRIFKQNFIKLMEKSNLISNLSFSGSDFRNSVKDLDYFLSFPLNNRTRKRLIEIVKSLGYIGLASVMSGEASLSKAKVWIENDKIYLQGKSCKPGFLAMRKIAGIVTPQYRGHNVPYSAPINEVNKFLEIVQQHWPLYEGDLNTIKKQAEELIKNSVNNFQQSNIVIDNNKATIKDNKNNTFTIKFPWVKDAPMYNLINKLKEIPKNNRKYDPITKTWICHKSYTQTIVFALETVFDKENIIFE